MTAPDLLSRIDAAIGLQPELADLLNECRAEIVRLSEAAAAPVVDNETAELLERLRGDDGEILRAIGGALNSVYMERARGGKVSDQGEEVRVHRAVLEAIRPAADRLEALAAAAPVVDVTEDVASEAAWLAKLARGSSWPGSMAQQVEVSAGRVIAWASSVMHSPTRPSDGA